MRGLKGKVAVVAADQAGLDVFGVGCRMLRTRSDLRLRLGPDSTSVGRQRPQNRPFTRLHPLCLAR
jgi:hypothetical protein